MRAVLVWALGNVGVLLESGITFGNSLDSKTPAKQAAKHNQTHLQFNNIHPPVHPLSVIYARNTDIDFSVGRLANPILSHHQYDAQLALS